MPDSIVVVTFPELAVGFRLVGTDVYVSKNINEAIQYIHKVVTDPNVGLLAIDDLFYSALDIKFLSKIDRRGKPIIVSIPSVKRLDETPTAEIYIKERIRRATGFYMKLDLES